jgi:DNA primase
MDDIKQRLDIVDVISEYLHLEKAGRNFKAICPFHSEKTASFFVSPERQSWHCFGCGAGGDVFSFIRRKEGVDFGEALKILAQKAGIPLVQKGGKDEKTSKLYQINEAAASYYHHLLLNVPAAQGARLYLERRGISTKTSEDFQLGYSLDSWDGVKQHLLGKGFSLQELIASGLLVEGGREPYDRFRGRVMFPIKDIKGHVLGFGARVLDDSLPKYINSPQTLIFDKGSTLYGLERAKDAIREQKTAVIVEGYMDVLTCHQYGMKNVVAAMGTALTEKQIPAIKGLTKNLTLALDADAAGDAATWRGIGILRQSLGRVMLPMPDYLGTTSQLSAEIKVISLPQGKDPDDVIRESSEEWRKLVAEALPMMDFFFATASKLDLTKPEAKAQAKNLLLPLIIEIEDEVERSAYLEKLSQLVGVKRRKLEEEAARLRPTAAEKVKTGEPISFRSSVGAPLEEYCLSLLLQYPELREKVGKLSPELFECSENQELFLIWQANPQDMESHLDINLYEHLSALSSRLLPPIGEKEREKALSDCIRRLEERKLRAELIFEAESALDAGNNLEQSSARLAAIQQQIVEGWERG